MKTTTFLIAVLVLTTLPLFAQNTVGIQLNEQSSINGYTLFSPRTSLSPRYTYLIDNCGLVINRWESEFPLFSTDYLMEDGSLYRSVVDDLSTLNIPGNTGRIEHLSWEGDMIWSATISDTDYSFHHDYVVLENGNILLLVAFRRSEEEAIAHGRDPETMSNGELYEERVWEIQPTTPNNYNLIWEWRSWDHLIQDFDASKLNFGEISENPQKVDFNFGTNFGEADWWHSNSISYNPERDHITISNRNLDEFIIIDHSTTTEEAMGSTGGNSGMGGDILYRYGNPPAYNQGTPEDKTLDAMHDVHFIPTGTPNAGKILIFNNQPEVGFSEVTIIDPVYDQTTSNYAYDGGAYSAGTIVLSYTDPDNFLAPFLSGSQELPNGNILITNGPSGNLFEITPEQEIVWVYQSPVANAEILSDTDAPENFQTRVYRSLRYPIDYPAFNGRDLTPGEQIELNPQDDNCSTLSLEEISSNQNTILYPNPALNELHIISSRQIKNIAFFSLSGQLLMTINDVKTNISSFKTGIYLSVITYEDNTQDTIKLIKE